MSGALAIAGRIILSTVRDRRGVFFVIFVPALLIALVGVTFDRPFAPVTIALADLDRGQGGARLGEDVARQLAKLPRFEVRELSPDAAARAVRDGDVDVAITLAPDFSERLITADEARLAVTVEGSDPARVLQVRQLLELAAVSFSDRPVLDNPPAVAIDATYLAGGPDFGTTDYFAPALLAGFVLLLVYVLTSAAFLGERTRGTLERLRVSAVSDAGLLGGYLLGYGAIALVQAAVLLAWSVGVVGIDHRGALWQVFAVEGLVAASAVALGILGSAVSRTELQALLLIPLVVVPQILLGGVIWPVARMPEYLRAASQFLPLTHAVDALREIMIRGGTLVDAAGDLAVLAAFTAVFLAAAAVAVRRSAA